MPDQKDKDEQVTTPLEDGQRTAPFGTPPPAGETPSPDLPEASLRPLRQRYDILAEVGRGGMGIVYKARDRETGDVVALKVLRPEIAARPEVIERFKSELLLARKITHKNVCRTYELLRFGDTVGIAMEYVEGESLRRLLKRVEGLSVRQGLKILRQMIAGLAEAHAQGVVHRDLKPENIVITRDGNVKVMDFGIARSLEAEATQTAGIVGTPAYMSPEQAEGKPVDARTDIYALGLIMYEMFTGQPTFAAETPVGFAYKQVHEKPAPVHSLDPYLPPLLERAIEKCLEKDPEKRPQSVAEVEADLRQKPEVAAARKPVLERAAHLVAASWSRAILFLSVGGVALGLLALSLGWWWGARSRAGRGPDWRLRQLTYNVAGDPLQSAAISPDGRYLAYATPEGIFLRLMETGETQRVSLPEGFCYGCESLSWFRDGTKLLASGGGPQGFLRPQIWVLPLGMGGEARKLRDFALGATVSPDGSEIAFVDPRQGIWDIWLMRPNGEEARSLARMEKAVPVEMLQWSPDGQRLAYLKSKMGSDEVTLESRDLKGGPARTISSDPRLTAFCWAPDGRIIYALKESFAEDDANLWEMPVDPDSGKASGKPRRITNWTGFSFSALSPGADGKTLVFLKRQGQMDVYAGELEANGTGLKTPLRLTLNERDDFPSAWTRDSQTVLIYSNRAGNYDIFKHGLQGRVAETLISGREEQTEARLSPDAISFLYWSYPTAAETPPKSKRLLRLPVAGGSPEVVVEAGWAAQFRCPSVPAADCVLSEEDKEKKLLVFSAFQPGQGTKRELTRIEVGEDPPPPWDLSPDGSRLGIAFSDKIRVIDLAGTVLHTIPTLRIPFDSIAWSADGTAFFAIRFTGRGRALLRIGLDGQTHVLMQKEIGGWLSQAVPSPDGRYLAFGVGTVEKNAWMMKMVE